MFSEAITSSAVGGMGVSTALSQLASIQDNVPNMHNRTSVLSLKVKMQVDNRHMYV